MGIGDYLSEGENARMTWVGLGAERLGLHGTCDLAHFERLCAGQHPTTGDKLMVRDKGAKRRVCFFGQVSAPKDVSLAYLVGGDGRIAQWWDEAVRATVTEIETTTLTRVRKSRAYEDRTTGNFVAAIVTHDSSRSLDPQLHTHVCILNLTYDPTEARWKSIQPSAYYRHQGFFREVCHQKLAARMLAAGYRLTDVRRGNFTVAGIPPALRDQFSKRRREILTKAAEVGAKSQDALQGVTSGTRTKKRQMSRADLLTRWRAEAGPELRALRRTVTKANGHRLVPPGLNPDQAIASAEAHLFERRSVVDEHELLREALHAGRGDVALDDLRTAIAARTRDAALLRIGDDLASPEALRSEEEFLSWAHAGRHLHEPLGTPPLLADLAPDQTAAVTGILSSRSRVTILLGDAGSGKTTTLKSIVAGIEQASGSIFACAPTATAADLLRHDLTSDAATLQRWLASDQLQTNTKGQTLIVDEAGLISGAQMTDLCRLADRHDNRLILVGDPKQHHSVEAGDALRALVKYSGVPVVRLQQIRRQQNPGYRAAVKLLADGKPREAFQQFEDLGAVIEIKSRSVLLERAAADYVRTTGAGQSCLVMSPIWSEIRRFNEIVRRLLQEAGRLGKKSLTLSSFTSFHFTREQRRQPANYHAGDIILFNRRAPGFKANEFVRVQATFEGRLEVTRSNGTVRWIRPHRIAGFDVGTMEPLSVAPGEKLLVQANEKNLRLKNGDLVEVSTIRADRTLLLRDGRSIPPDFHRIVHGYAATSHSSQGRTVDRGILLLGDDALRAADAKQAYVSNSRFHLSQAIYTTDKESAATAFARPGDRMLVKEALETELQQNQLTEERPAPSADVSA